VKKSAKQKPGEPSRKNRQESDCVIPPPPIKETLASYTLSSRADERAIRDYVEWQGWKGKQEKVQHAELVKTEHTFGRDYDCWDVHTNLGRWWVITSPTNLYSQELFPSLDYTLSFHVGVTTRMHAADRGVPDDAQRSRLTPVWRRWQQAAEALDTEAEEFQAVGVRCRECLIQLVRSLSQKSMVPEGQETPQRGNVISWCELIANTIAGGASAEHIRGHLKSISKSAWQLAGWLTHASNAGRYDAHFVLETTQSAITAFGGAALRFESGSPNRCPKCGSYSISIGYNADLNPQYISSCERCDWSTIGAKKHPRATKLAATL